RGKMQLPDDAGDSWFSNWVDQTVSRLSSNTWAIIAIVTFLLFLAGLAAYLFMDNVLMRKIGFFGGALMIVATILANLAAFHVYHKATSGNGAIIMPETVTLSTAPREPRDKDEEAFQQFERPQSLSVWALPAQTSRIENAGFASTAYRLRFQQLLATPLMFAAMSILAAAFSLRLMRLGDMARMAVSAVVLGFAFFFVNQFSAAMGSAEVIPPFIAAWLPAILTALAALTLLFYTEDG
ncbi:LptF/LptG family permease, partial [uncultured Brevundimonas sp.]|uniref:LptF/LptG family permease n=1 Tax=uncultured Brevundimonas sp. TaxID=213418 RepID=UPI0026180905